MSIEVYVHQPVSGASWSPVRRSRWILRTGIVSFFSLVTWAYFAEIDQVSRASGQIIASQRTQVVQSPDGGVLKSILVREGEEVRTGQLIATIEPNRAQALNDDTEARIAALRITLQRLRAEISGKPLRFSEDLLSYREYIENQSELFSRRSRAISEDLTALRASLDLVTQELVMNEGLLKSGDVSRSEVLRLQRQASEIRGQIASRRNRYYQEAQAEMTKAEEELRTQSESLRERRQILQQTRLIAPADGIIKNLLVNTVGGVLRPGETFAEILPVNGGLVIEAKLSPTEIGFVRLGQQASISLDAFDSSIFGYLHGRVTYISADTLTEEQRQGRLFYYRVLVQLDELPSHIDSHSPIRIVPGMTATVSIKSMQRSVLSYLTKPITKTLVNAMGER